MEKQTRVLIIGAGGVGNVVAKKASRMFDYVCLASRTLSKCEAIASEVKKDKTTQAGEIETAQVDADNVPELVALIKRTNPEIVINVALPYQDLTIMTACLECKVHYLDTANYEAPDEAKFEYKQQWAFQEKFKKAGITAVLGCGFDPGVTGIYCAHALKHHFDEIHYLDIVDCNGGDHGQSFATNFNPEINIREITQKGRYYQNSAWHETEPLEIHQKVHYPQIGEKESYLLFHEELESLVKNIPGLKQARFWMTFSQNYITHLEVLENVGMTRIDEIDYQGQKIVPLTVSKSSTSRACLSC